MLSGIKDRGDIVDWAKAGGSRARLDALVDTAEEWKPPSEQNNEQNEADKAKAKADEDELLDALAKLPNLDYERQREDAQAKSESPVRDERLGRLG